MHAWEVLCQLSSFPELRMISFMLRMKTLGLKPDYLLIYLAHTFVASTRTSWSLSEAGGAGWGGPASSFMGLSPSLQILSASAFLSLVSCLPVSCQLTSGLSGLPPLRDGAFSRSPFVISSSRPDASCGSCEATALWQLSSSSATSLDSLDSSVSNTLHSLLLRPPPPFFPHTPT